MSAQENNITITDDSYLIDESPKDFYTGIYKDNKPYDGYFKKENVEFFTVDYYEKGIKKYNYSSDVLQILNDKVDDHHRLKLNVKSIYKNESIYHGVKYNYSKNAILVEQFDNSHYKGFYIDIFAVHYYNRISVEINQGKLKIQSLQDKNCVIKVFLKNNLIIAEFRQGDTVLVRAQIIDPINPMFPANSEIRLYKENGIFKGNSYQVLDKYNSFYEEHAELFDIFSKLDIYTTKSPFEVFIKLLKHYKEENDNTKYQTELNDFILLAKLVSDENGYCKEGIRFYENKGDSYYLIIKEGKTIKKEKIQMVDFQDIINSYLEDEYNGK